MQIIIGWLTTKSIGIPSPEQQQQLDKILRYMKVLGY